MATVVVVLAATYTYKCPKCGLIQSYGQPNPGVKCPNDGWSMVSQ
jgi:DNA-directed RNA polymerase subunit RPC12/RpoP